MRGGGESFWHLQPRSGRKHVLASMSTARTARQVTDNIDHARLDAELFDLLQDPQERYDLFMTNWTEHTWTAITFNDAIGTLMKTYVQYPPRKLQSESYAGPITITSYQRFQWVREALAKDGVNIGLPTGN